MAEEGSHANAKSTEMILKTNLISGLEVAQSPNG